MPPVNVLFIDHTTHPSGAAISLGTLIRYLPPRFKRHFIIRKRSRVAGLLGVGDAPCHVENWMPDFPTTCFTPKPYSVLLWSWHFAKLPIAFRNFWRICKAWKIDLVHANESCLVGYVVMAWLLNLPIVLHARCSVAKGGLPLLLLKLGARYQALRVVAIDEETYRSFPAVLREKANVVFNPVVMPLVDETMREQLRTSWGISETDIAVGQVANLHPGKGVWDVFELAKNICPSHPEIKFVFVGNDAEGLGEGPALKAATQQHGLEKNVVFAGHIAEVAKAYAALDITLCLFAFKLNGVGRTVYEAALARRPMITVLEIEKSSTLLNGGLGIICPPHDLKRIAAQICRLAADPGLRKALADRAHDAIGSRHDPRSVSRQVEQLYDELFGTLLVSAKSSVADCRTS